MAEKPEDQSSVDEKIQRAKELIGRGTRNFYVNSFADAADDLSQACSIYSDLYGDVADELGSPYLIYAKSLIAVAQDENKIMDIPEEDEEEGGEGEDQDEDSDKNEEADADKSDEDKTEAATSTTNGNHEKSEVDAAVSSTSSAAVDLANQEPSSSTGHTNGDKEGEDKTEDEGDDDAEGIASLEVAWEVLELAVKIFDRQGEPGLPQLAESYSELANISFENSNFEIAIKDYNKSYDVYTDLPEPSRRILAEIKYKIGLCYVMMDEYDESIKSFKEACELFDDEINTVKANENETEEIKQETIKDLEETKQEIKNKLIEVEESKLQSAEVVKRELAKLYGTISSSSTTSNGAGPSPKTGGGDPGPGPSSSSSSSDANKSKPSDISHLIKRKVPDAAVNSTEDGPPPAKKPSI